MNNLLLEGQVDTRDETIRELRERLRKSEEDLFRQAQRTASVEQGVTALRQVCLPLYRALQQMYGASELMGLAEEAQSLPSPKWEAWQKRLGGKAAEFIGQLLIHGAMSGQQLKVATKCGQQTVYDTIRKLNQAQLLNKNGGKYSLKDI